MFVRVFIYQKINISIKIILNEIKIKFYKYFGNYYKMVIIRLTRKGAKNRPFFNIIATDSRNSRDGRFIERIGFYNPLASKKEKKFKILLNRFTYWKQVGAKTSLTVDRLIRYNNKNYFNL